MEIEAIRLKLAHIETEIGQTILPALTSLRLELDHRFTALEHTLMRNFGELDHLIANIERERQ
ncbi:MAG: hypothetical protein ACREMT_02675 [Vulcanimicrobiaceae bacterium]